MSKRLNQEREAELQPLRFEYAVFHIEKLGYKITFRDKTRLEFVFNDSTIKFYPYSGWHSGKTIKDGRGIGHLISQIKPKR